MDEEISIPPVEKYGDIYIHANGQMGYIQGEGANTLQRKLNLFTHQANKD